MEETKTNDIRVAELFAGIGGFRLGLEQASQLYSNKYRSTNELSEGFSNSVRPSCGFRIVWANEWDKYACQIYRKNFGEKELCEGDIRKVNTNNIPECNLIVGGFPCQPHSMAGKRKGFSEERGTVFHEIIRIAKAKQPEMLLLENVKGLLSSEQGRAFGTVLEELGNIGYWCEWKTLNSKYAGVPQNRERVFIIGHLRGTSTRKIFPLPEIIEKFVNSRSEAQGKRTRFRVANPLGIGGSFGERNLIAHQNISNNVTLHEEAQALRSGASHSYQMVVANGSENLISKTVRANHHNSYNAPMITDKSQVRRLTPTECERLQDFPDGWTQGISDTQRYKTLGNAVTVSVIAEIGELMLLSFNSSEGEVRWQ